MRAVFYSHTGQVSGAEVILLLLLREIDRERFEPVFIGPPDGGLAQKVGDLGIERRPVGEVKARFTWNPVAGIRYLSSLIAAVLELRAGIREIDPQFVHANSVRAGLVATLATSGTKTPIFWHIQDELRLHPFSTAVRIVALMSNRVRLIAASAATGESFLGILLSVLGRRIPTTVVHNAIDLIKFNRNEKRRAKHRLSLSLPDGEFVFGVVGQITPRKGQLELVKAFSEVAPTSPMSLLIIGEPLFNTDHKYLEALRSEIASRKIENSVRILGARDDIPDIMRSLDALVVNSSSEAFVVVGIEAMATGTPVIATDVGGIREMITHRESGLLVPYGDRKSLVGAMAELSSNEALRKSISLNGERFVIDKLSAEKFVSDMERFFIEESTERKKKTSFVNQGRAKSNV